MKRGSSTMSLAEKMEHLSHHIIESYDQRIAFIEESQQNTAAFLQQADVDHRTMAAQQRKQRREYVANLRRTTATTLDKQKMDRQKMAKQQRQQLNTFTNTLRQDTAEFLLEQKTNHATMADSQRKYLALEKANLVDTIVRMRRDIQRDQYRAQQTWNGLGTSMQQRRSGKPINLPLVFPPKPTVALQRVVHSRTLSE
jgi:hypothetical protein